jgi:hypothetical protein
MKIMKKLKLQVQMTVDGYIAGPNLTLVKFSWAATILKPTIKGGKT